MSWIQMKGHWLDQAGFSIDTPVTARVMEGCLVLTTDKQQDDCIKN
ncbi:MAG: SymE family type I addiction module toxin [Candidatus Thiodiazotropha sp.]